MTVSVLCHSRKKSNYLLKAEVKRMEILSADARSYLPTYLPTYVPIYLPTYLPTYRPIYLSIYLLNLSHREPAYQSRQLINQILEFRFHSFFNANFVPKKKCHQNYSHHSPFRKTKQKQLQSFPSVLSNILKLQKFPTQTHISVFFVFCQHIQETIKAPPCGSPGPELHFPVLASQVPSSCAQLLASFFQ